MPPLEILATSRALADGVADAAAAALPSVQTLSVDRRFAARRRVVCAFDEPGEVVHGRANDHRIELHVGRESPSERTRYIIAHELAHSFLDDEWHRMPAVLEEGVCELIAQAVVPEFGIERRADHAVHLATVIQDAFVVTDAVADGGEMRPTSWRFEADVDVSSFPSPAQALEITRADLREWAPRGQRAALTSLGYLLARRIGLTRIHAMCRDVGTDGSTRVPSHRIFSAAMLDGTRLDTWMPAVEELASPDEIVRVARASGLDGSARVQAESR